MESTKTPASKQPILVLLAGIAANLRKKMLQRIRWSFERECPNGHCGRYRDRPLATIPIRMPTPNATAIAMSGRCSVSLEIWLRAAVPYRAASLPKVADCSLSELVPWRKRSAQLDKADATASPRPSAGSRAFDEARSPVSRCRSEGSEAGARCLRLQRRSLACSVTRQSCRLPLNGVCSQWPMHATEQPSYSECDAGAGIRLGFDGVSHRFLRASRSLPHSR